MDDLIDSVDEARQPALQLLVKEAWEHREEHIALLKMKGL